MLKYTLVCPQSHEFEGWFNSEEGFLEQRASEQIPCPYCGDTAVKRGVGAPAIIGRFQRHVAQNEQKIIDESVKQLRQLRSFVESNFENYGRDFVKAARELHKARLKEDDGAERERSDDQQDEALSEVMISASSQGESKKNKKLGVYGQANEEEYMELCEEGIKVQLIPWIKREDS